MLTVMVVIGEKFISFSLSKEKDDRTFRFARALIIVNFLIKDSHFIFFRLLQAGLV